MGSRGTVARQLEGRWEYVSRPPTGGQALYAVHSLAWDRAWVMGTGGLMFYYNHDRWENKTDPRVTSRTIRALRMTSDGRQGWAVGEAAPDSGTILRFNSQPNLAKVERELRGRSSLFQWRMPQLPRSRGTFARFPG